MWTSLELQRPPFLAALIRCFAGHCNWIDVVDAASVYRNPIQPVFVGSRAALPNLVKSRPLLRVFQTFLHVSIGDFACLPSVREDSISRHVRAFEMVELEGVHLKKPHFSRAMYSVSKVFERVKVVLYMCNWDSGYVYWE